MQSRMEKYYHEDLSKMMRTKKNEKLYKEVYGNLEIDDVPLVDNSDVIDASELNKMITSRGEYQKLKEYELVKEKKKEEVIEEEVKKEQKQVYDINEFLTKAKLENSKLKDMSIDEVKETQKKEHNFLMDMEASELPKVDDFKFHTKEISKDPHVTQIVNTNSLPLDILTDLKPTDDTIVSEPVLEQTRKLENDLNKTFYSGSYNFSKKDFMDEDFKDLEDKHNGLKIFLIVIGIVALMVVIFFAIKYLQR